MTAAKTPFVDTVNDWSADGIAKCYGSGIMTGTTTTTFNPSSQYTAEQSVVTLVRMLDYFGK